MKIIKPLLHLFIIILLTAITQTGGVIYIISLFLIRNQSKKKRLKRFLAFTLTYLLTTFLVIPYMAPIFGREKIKESKNVKAHSFFYKLTNRNYVKPEMNDIITNISNDFSSEHKGIKLVYLDANFPFIDGFPLLPHLSHNDGKKLDVSLIYEEKGVLTNKKPSISGYGVYEEPINTEYNQTLICKKNGNWQYDFPKYLTFGRINKEIKFSKKGTKNLAKEIINQPEVGKIFIEPHLKQRFELTSKKVRFHGCQAVRHDDHIHFQLK